MTSLVVSVTGKGHPGQYAVATQKADDITGGTTPLEYQFPVSLDTFKPQREWDFIQMRAKWEIRKGSSSWILEVERSIVFLLLHNTFPTHLVTQNNTSLSHISIGVHVSWVFGSESHQGEIKVSAVAPVSSGAQGPFPSSLGVDRIQFLGIGGRNSHFPVGWPPGVTVSS